VLIELGVVEQRHKAVLEVAGGLSVTEVALRYGVTRQTVHRWLRRYEAGGLEGLTDASSRPQGCPHQLPAQSRSASSSCAARTPAGDRPPSATASRVRALCPCPAAPRSTAASSDAA